MIASLVGEPIGLLEIVGRQQDRESLAGQAPDLFPDVRPSLRIEAGRRLVEEQDLGSMDEAARHVELALHPARPGPDDPIGGLGQAEPREQLVDAMSELGPAHPVEVALEEEVLAPGRVRIDGAVLADHPDEPAHAVRLAGHVDAQHVIAARVGARQGGQDLDRRRLPGPVGSEQAEDRPGLDRQADPVEGAHATRIRLDEIHGIDGRRTSGLQERRGGRLLPRRSTQRP